MVSSESDNIQTVAPEEFPFYENEPKEIASALPQGPGSGTDSDTVDGFQAARRGPNKLIVSDSSGLIPTTAGGLRIKVVTYSGLVSATAQIPFDDTIPQSSEGTEVMSISFTPSSSTSDLIIEACAFGASSSTGNDGGVCLALFKDSETDARAAVFSATPFGGADAQLNQSYLLYKMTAGTTSPITFSVRLGSPTATAVSMNGITSQRRYGGVATSWIKVTETTLVS